MQWQRHRQSAWKTQHMLYFWNPDDSLIPNMMIDTSPWSSCSHQSPRSPCVEKFDRVEQRHFCDTNGGCQDVNGFTPGLQFAATRTLFSLHFKKPTKFQFRHPSRDQGGTKTQIFWHKYLSVLHHSHAIPNTLINFWECINNKCHNLLMSHPAPSGDLICMSDTGRPRNSSPIPNPQPHLLASANSR